MCAIVFKRPKDSKKNIKFLIQRVLLETLPKILIVHLKRFKITDYSQQKKLNYAVNIPNDISLDFLLKDREKNKENNTLYNLSAIVVHVGKDNSYGHYYCLVKNSGKWVKFDDEKVSLYEKNDLLEFFGSPDEDYSDYNSEYCAYLLFYEISE
jgi:ubiquitin C-terminal hydrolase